MYITNNVFTWTDELIANFRAMEYFLAFAYKAVGKPDSGIGWERIDPSKGER